MYKCEKCGEEFKEPELLREIHTQCPEQPYEVYGACPCCHCLRIERIDTYD